MIRWTSQPAVVAEWSDRDLLGAWDRTDGEGDEAEVLIAEIERRGLDL